MNPIQTEQQDKQKEEYHQERIRQLSCEIQNSNLSPKQYRHKYAEFLYWQNKLKQHLS